MSMATLLDALITRESVVHAFRREDGLRATNRTVSPNTHNVARVYQRQKVDTVRAKAAELREFSVAELVRASGASPSRVREMMKNFRTKQRVECVAVRLTQVGGLEKVWRWVP